eukprot:s392_g30.t1
MAPMSALTVKDAPTLHDADVELREEKKSGRPMKLPKASAWLTLTELRQRLEKRQELQKQTRTEERQKVWKLYREGLGAGTEEAPMAAQERTIALSKTAAKLVSQDFAKTFNALATLAWCKPTKDEAKQHGLLHVAWQIELLVHGAAVSSGVQEPSATRWDCPKPVEHGRASMAKALEAASVNNRKRALEELDEGVLAATTRPAIDSRVRVYEEICKAWEVASWPITYDSLRCFAASLKRGQYRSANLYFQAIFGHQQRVLTAPVDDFLRQASKNFCRSITRGMGPSRLKDSFDVALLGRLATPGELLAFDPQRVDHAKDVAILASWFMLRELEVASSKFSHLYLSGDVVNLLIPQHKTDQVGSLTLRSLRCACRIRRHALCPFHAAERHLTRVSAHREFRRQALFPLVPDPQGLVMTKADMVDMFRRTIAATGTAVDRPDDRNVLVPRYGGHVFRVSGAQFLCHQQVPISTIQLLGRWTSNAIERYLQAAPLVQLHNVAPVALQGISPAAPAFGDGGLAPVSREEPTESSAVCVEEKEIRQRLEVPVGDPDPRISGLAEDISSLRASLTALKGVVQNPDTVLVHRKRSMVVHQGESDERANHPMEWRTRCGWHYGAANFDRISSISGEFRKCRKCFRHEEALGLIASESDGSQSGSDSSSSSS